MTKQSEAEKAAEEYFLSMMEDIPGDIHEVPPKTLHIPIKEMPPLIRNAFLAGAAWAAPKWISVKERLPEVGVEVLGLVGSMRGTKLTMTIGEYSKEWKAFYCERFGEMGIEFLEFWMPLPAAPEVEK